MTLLFGWVDWPTLAQWARPRAMTLALFAVAAAGVVAAGWRMRGPRASGTRAAGMSWWVVLAAAIVVVVVAWGATSWLLGEASAAKDPGAARVDAIKTGLGIGAGTTGIFALLLAVRRQWHSETDSTEKNVTELYTKAADQLGSAEAPVRLAGLYALERLAHNNPAQRQSIVNVICAYLRMPYTPPGSESGPAESDPAQRQASFQEREVRLTGQRILTGHLNPSDRSAFWDGIDLDLTNARLIAFDLSNCRLRTARFIRATLDGNPRFRGATFTGTVSFGAATFTDAWFYDAQFQGDAWFGGATFAGTTRFDGARFAGIARFPEATFAGDAWFGRATFIGDARFLEATFLGDAEFDGAKFTRDVWFDGTRFIRGARFTGATFTEDARFGDVMFTDDAWFGRVTFTEDAQFDGATFTGEAGFGGATFARGARFTGATFTGPASFDQATITRTVSFDEATFAGSLPAISHRLAEKTSFADAILTVASHGDTGHAGLVVDARGKQAAAND